MNVKETIESGSLELYVMGALPPEEMQEIDMLRKAHPELNDEILRIEDAMMAYADSHAIKPREELKEEIAKKLEFSVTLDMTSEMVDSIQIRMPGIYKLAAAAAIALIIALTGTTWYFSRQFRLANNELTALHNEKDQLAGRVNVLNEQNGKIAAELAIAQTPATVKINLAGTKISPNANAIVYWDKSSGTAYLNSSALPATPANKQYQLWAIVNGKPVDLGVVSKTAAFSSMKQVQNASAFAITLEPLGGSAAPTLDLMYAVGNV